MNGIETNYNFPICEDILNTDNSNPMTIGRESQSIIGNFLINRVVTWRRALSTFEVLNNLNLDMDMVWSALSMNTYWSMDEGSGNIVYDGLYGSDSNPNNHNGTIYGAEWSDDVPSGW